MSYPYFFDFNPLKFYFCLQHSFQFHLALNVSNFDPPKISFFSHRSSQFFPTLNLSAQISSLSLSSQCLISPSSKNQTICLPLNCHQPTTGSLSPLTQGPIYTIDIYNFSLLFLSLSRYPKNIFLSLCLDNGATLRAFLLAQKCNKLVLTNHMKVVLRELENHIIRRCNGRMSCQPINQLLYKKNYTSKHILFSSSDTCQLLGFLFLTNIGSFVRFF